MSKKCGKCGLPLGFKKLPSGKWCPTNPDGSDHWDLCRETWLAALPQDERDYLAERDAERARGVWTGSVKRVYAGATPPWDESLGPFREFTAEELRSRVTVAPSSARRKKREVAA